MSVSLDKIVPRLMPKPSGVPRQAVEQVTGPEAGKSKFPIYDGAPLGFPEYWYPVMWSRELSSRQGKPIVLLGREIVFFRDGGKAYALEDRCPHRGVQIHPAPCDFPGTRTCPYHGWVFDLKSGKLVAALTDGPDSPIVAKGNIRIRTYPVEERCGLVWIYMGEQPPPVETDIPDEFLMSDAILTGRITTRAGDWRYGCENGYDEGHVKYLHRRGVWTFWRRAPAWGWSAPRLSEDGQWLTRDLADIGFGAEYPGFGYWPPKNWWRWRRGARGIRFRMPGALRVQYGHWAHYEWYVPTTPGYHRYLQFICRRARGPAALWHYIKYYCYIRPFFHRQFNNQDVWMVENMTPPPEILYRPDRSMQSLRQYVEDNARGIARSAPPPDRYATKKAQNEVIS